MAKETFYFSHDYGARNDPKLIKVLMRLGQEGKGVFWDLIEMLYEQDGKLMLSECESYAFALRTNCDVIESLISEFGLFEKDDVFFWSSSVNVRLNKRNEKSKKAKDSANERWLKAKNKENDANALQTQSDSNANKVKESKIKESKEEENKVNNNSLLVVAPLPEKKHEKFNFKNALLECGVNEDLANEFILVRKSLKAVNTRTSLLKIWNECKKNNFPFVDAVKICIENSWKGFKYEWVLNLEKKSNHGTKQDDAATERAEFRKRNADYISNFLQKS